LTPQSPSCPLPPTRHSSRTAAADHNRANRVCTPHRAYPARCCRCRRPTGFTRPSVWVAARAWRSPADTGDISATKIQIVKPRYSSCLGCSTLTETATFVSMHYNLLHRCGKFQTRCRNRFSAKIRETVIDEPSILEGRVIYDTETRYQLRG